MERTIISFDYAIKTVLRDKANFDVLSGFLTELLEKPVEVLEILESEGNIESQFGKINRTDLKAKISYAKFKHITYHISDAYGKTIFEKSKSYLMA